MQSEQETDELDWNVYGDTDRSGGGEVQPPIQVGVQAISSRVRIVDEPFTVDVNGGCRGQLRLTQHVVDETYRFRIFATGDDARGMASVEISGEDLADLYKEIGEVLDK